MASILFGSWSGRCTEVEADNRITIVTLLNDPEEPRTSTHETRGSMLVYALEYGKSFFVSTLKCCKLRANRLTHPPTAVKAKVGGATLY